MSALPSISAAEAALLDDDQLFCEQYASFWTAARRQRFLVGPPNCLCTAAATLCEHWIGGHAASLFSDRCLLLAYMLSSSLPPSRMSTATCRAQTGWRSSERPALFPCRWWMCKFICLQHRACTSACHTLCRQDNLESCQASGFLASEVRFMYCEQVGGTMPVPTCRVPQHAPLVAAPPAPVLC
jgi:hypothetical protein